MQQYGVIMEALLFILLLIFKPQNTLWQLQSSRQFKNLFYKLLFILLRMYIWACMCMCIGIYIVFVWIMCVLVSIPI